MARQTYRANLSASVYPMTLAKSGKAVIIPGSDQNFDRRIDSPGDTPRGSVSIPQLIYAENLVPTPDGYQSIGYTQDTPISMPVDEDITAVIPVGLATIATETEVTLTETILFDDDGTETGWTFSTYNFTGSGGDYSENFVAADAGGGNPDDSYNFQAASSGMAWVHGGIPAWMYRNFPTLGDPDNFAFRFDVAIGVADDEILLVGVCNNAAGEGYKVLLDNRTADPKLVIGTANTWADMTGFVPLAEVAITPLSAGGGTWYEVEVTIVRISGDSRTITATLLDNADVVLSTISCISSFSLNTYVGLGREVPVEQQVIVDNLQITGDATETTTTITELTGLTTAYISFFSDDTAKWSYDLDTWDNHSVTVPGGFVSPASLAVISVAIVRGVTYICITDSGATKIYTAAVDTGTNVITLTDVSATIEDGLPTPFDIDSILGIVGSYNYLILYTGATILWSSTTTPTDFAASLVSGSGNEVPGNLKGDISFCKEHVAGFFIYSTKNVVFSQYTGNARYPWRFREVSGSGGYNFSTQVAGDTNSAVQYGLNNTKLVQILSPDSAELVAPEVTDFIERSLQWDIFDTADWSFSLSGAGLALIPATKPTTYFLLDRYLLLPYGMSDTDDLQWTYVIVYDALLKRYGKFRITFDFCLSDEEKIYFINRLTGIIYELYFDINVQNSPTSVHSGVAVFGKFQYVRSRLLTLEGISVETIQDSSIIPLADRNFSIRVFSTLDGKTFQDPVTPYDATSILTPNALDVLAHVTCKNFAIAMQGAFNLDTLELTFHTDGDS